MKKLFLIGLIVVFFFTQFVNAQPGPSFSASYDFYPYSNLADPDAGTFFEDLEIRVATLKLNASQFNMSDRRLKSIDIADPHR